MADQGHGESPTVSVTCHCHKAWQKQVKEELLLVHSHPSWWESFWGRSLGQSGADALGDRKTTGQLASLVPASMRQWGPQLQWIFHLRLPNLETPTQTQPTALNTATGKGRIVHPQGWIWTQVGKRKVPAVNTAETQFWKQSHKLHEADGGNLQCLSVLRVVLGQRESRPCDWLIKAVMQEAQPRDLENHRNT